ncbi:MAG: geranylgeranylglyceryl/heptaprenylglyceryl phosphate synthase [Verrucomicrobia bacterium]|nr:geranylgeranylglyceryl/heptaprenylglyceryl phosphate synthase [Verrucomicrobiota bacterium]
MQAKNKNLLNNIKEKASNKLPQIALLIDPDKLNEAALIEMCKSAEKCNVDFLLVGGSLLTSGDLNTTVNTIKSNCNLKCLLFPGSASQISPEADGILFLSLLSSRNPEMLIGQQVVAAPYLRKTNLEVIPTAYMIVESGKQTTASYISNSNPIPADKAEIAASTALAGEYMGMAITYLDAGSGAQHPVPLEMIQKVREFTQNPIIVGGGINNQSAMTKAFEAGADVIVIGTAVEQDPEFMQEIKAIKTHNY